MGLPYLLVGAVRNSYLFVSFQILCSVKSVSIRVFAA